ncbi:MAG: carboxypeptidase-like regulatory domain-containing protein [Ferruginibacter sp.]
MKKFLPYFLLFILIAPISAKAQFETFKDTVVQLYGVVMTAEDLKGIPAASIVIKGQNRGTISNADGVFSIVVLKGDKVEFTSIGFRPILITIPTDLVGNQHSIIQLMVTDTAFLPATIIKPRPTSEQFERDFINNNVPDDKFAIAQRNTSATTRRLLMAALPSDGREATNHYLRNYAQTLTYKGQIAPQNILNPFAWNEFIKAWKRGDYKRKK